MADIQQNTLYLTTPATYLARDHLTLPVEVPVYPEELVREERTRDRAVEWRKVSIPIHHLESICVFGPSTISPPALDLCWEHGVAVNYLSELGYLQARMTGVADTSVTLALDLMEEFRPWLADRLAVTLINRQQIGPEDFKSREGGAVEFTEAGRKRVIKAYQDRKQESLNHPLLDQNLRIAKLPFVQARVLARHLRGDLPAYLPFVPK